MSEELKQHNPTGYNPSTGIYVSSQIFTGDWENELAALDYTPREKAVAETLEITRQKKEAVAQRQMQKNKRGRKKK